MEEGVLLVCCLLSINENPVRVDTSQAKRICEEIVETREQ